MLENGINKEVDYDRLRQKKILLAEDVKLNQYIAKHILESWGCKVTIANDGREALELLQQNCFDCILMDVQMPELDGVEATEHIRKFSDPVKAAIPIIALTANALTSDREKYIKVGMNDCIAKPFDESELFAIITKNILGNSFSGTEEINQSSRSNKKILPEEKLYDLSMVLSVSGGDVSFIKKMVLLFIETVPQNVVELRKSVDAENWDQVARIAHKLKSTIDSMGIKSIYQDIRSAETNAKQKANLNEIPSLTQKIESVIDNCVKQLQAEL
jgi:CheY-like chemotaxis protein